MKLEQRSFSGKTFRPAPEILLNKQLGLFAVATAWGPDFETKKILDFLVQNYESYSSDEEKTNIHQKLSSLSKDENILRSLILSCNEWIFKEQNGDYRCGYELLCGHLTNGKFIFIQAGQPFIYLNRQDLPLQSLGHVLDFSALFAKKGRRLPPLPSNLLGIYPDTHFAVFSLPLLPEDRLLFISRDFAPASLLDIPYKDRNLEHLSQLLSTENQNSPFWLGELSFQPTDN